MYLKYLARRAGNSSWNEKMKDRNEMTENIPPIPIDIIDSFAASTSELCGHNSAASCTYQHSPVIKFSMLYRVLNSLRNIAMSATSKPEVIFVLGGPGAGKGTQCTNIVNKFGYVHLSAGELLREEQDSPGSKYGELIKGHMVNGTIVPVSITCGLLAQAMEKSATNKFLIDGFPRNKDNLEGWNEAMSDKVKLLGVLFFDCSKQTCIDRCLRRGAAGSGRSDDNEETLKKRFDTFLNATLPIVNHYEKQELVYKIDATKTTDQVFEDVEKILQRLKGLD